MLILCCLLIFKKYHKITTLFKVGQNSFAVAGQKAFEIELYHDANFEKFAPNKFCDDQFKIPDDFARAVS